MGEGTGADLGSIYDLLAEVANTVSRHNAALEQVSGEMIHYRSTLATKDELASLRRTVNEYHASVLGQGILVSALDERLRRIERHLAMPRLAAG
jgi:hypothetical protein